MECGTCNDVKSHFMQKEASFQTRNDVLQEILELRFAALEARRLGHQSVAAAAFQEADRLHLEHGVIEEELTACLEQDDILGGGNVMRRMRHIKKGTAASKVKPEAAKPQETPVDPAPEDSMTISQAGSPSPNAEARQLGDIPSLERVPTTDYAAIAQRMREIMTWVNERQRTSQSRITREIAEARRRGLEEQLRSRMQRRNFEDMQATAFQDTLNIQRKPRTSIPRTPMEGASPLRGIVLGHKMFPHIERGMKTLRRLMHEKRKAARTKQVFKTRKEQKLARWKAYLQAALQELEWSQDTLRAFMALCTVESAKEAGKRIVADTIRCLRQEATLISESRAIAFVERNKPSLTGDPQFYRSKASALKRLFDIPETMIPEQCMDSTLFCAYDTRVQPSLFHSLSPADQRGVPVSERRRLLEKAQTMAEFRDFSQAQLISLFLLQDEVDLLPGRIASSASKSSSESSFSEAEPLQSWHDGTQSMPQLEHVSSFSE